MAHGTGNYWITLDRATIKTNEYIVMFQRLRHYYYPDMSDSYEPTWEWKDEYAVEIGKWYNSKRTGLVYNESYSECDAQRMAGINKDEANKIWWNVKNRALTFEDVKQYLLKRNQELKQETLKRVLG